MSLNATPAPFDQKPPSSSCRMRSRSSNKFRQRGLPRSERLLEHLMRAEFGLRAAENGIPRRLRGCWSALTKEAAHDQPKTKIQSLVALNLGGDLRLMGDWRCYAAGF